MSLPLPNTDTTFELFLQELPEAYRDPAIAIQSFYLARKIKTPAPLIRKRLRLLVVDGSRPPAPGPRGIRVSARQVLSLLLPCP
jgi:hypothetical protein